MDVAWRSTNVFGWPQLVVSVYGSDALGRDVLRGSGAVHVPTTPGRHAVVVPLFAPLASTGLQGMLAALSGRAVEFADHRFPAYGEGREVTRVRSGGHVRLTLDVATRGMEEHGYDAGA